MFIKQDILEHLASGALAGIGGYMLITNIYTVYNGTVAGYGFLAMAVMILVTETIQDCFSSSFFLILNCPCKWNSLYSFLENLGFSNEVLKMFTIYCYISSINLLTKTNQGPGLMEYLPKGGNLTF